VSAADVFNMLGIVCHGGGRLDEAQTAFEEALAINPAYTEAALNLAVTYNDLGRYEDAKQIYRTALAQGAKHAGGVTPYVRGKIANLHADVAQAYLDAGLTSEAMHELRKAVLLCPQFADLRLKLANMYREQGDLQAAAYELEEALKVKPLYVPAQVALGVVRFSLGDLAQAMRSWRRALEIDPDDRTAQMYMRMAEQRVPSMPVPPSQ
jgi:tetratricopeptide (TPR) repeat protein